MPRAKNRPESLPKDADLIRRRWYEAKANDPSLTQAEFVRRAIPSYHVNPVVTKGKNKGQRKSDEQIADSRGRYLRLILEGKRGGSNLVRRSVTRTTGVPNGYQANVWLGEEIGWRSINIVAAGHNSTLDVFQIEQSPKLDAIVKAEAKAMLAKYFRVKPVDINKNLNEIPTVHLPIGAYEVKKIKTYRTQPIYLSGSE